MVRRGSRVVLAAVALVSFACTTDGGGSRTAGSVQTAQHLVLITIDTLRADRVGSYGYTAAKTPAMDDLASNGARFTRAFTTAPITLPAHASLLTGRYPPGHGARHNGVAMIDSIPTLATALKAAGFRTAAFVSAFPLDDRFGLARGFEIYDDELVRGADGKPLNERAGDETVQRAVSWLTADTTRRLFVWVHLFEPHAPYGDPATMRPVAARYDEEIAASDRFVNQLLTTLGNRMASTLIVLAADHGEAFGEHDETGHSIFVYDTTLRIPLLIRGPGIRAGTVVDAPVSMVDIAPTVQTLLGVPLLDTDGVSLVPLLTGGSIGERMIYAESFAPLLDFGWSPLRSVRDADWKYIAAPRAELYNLSVDSSENSNLANRDPQRSTRLLSRVESFGRADASATKPDVEAAKRLRSLGYLGGGPSPGTGSNRPDPKDRVRIASRLAEVTSGELRRDARIPALEAVLKEDPNNPQAHLRLGYAELERSRCDRAEPHLRTALDARLPSADAGLGLADCRLRAKDFRGAAQALEAARALEPGNPVVEANLGLVALARNDSQNAIKWLQAALATDPNLLEARFALARALGRAGRRDEAAAEARRLLLKLPPNAPQRAEVQRLIEALSR
jgi:choline-sulfatase